MANYKITASTTLGDVAPLITAKFKSKENALKHARQTAEELYYLNPKRDILDIMKDENDIDEDTAKIIFQFEMIQNIKYQAEEI